MDATMIKIGKGEDFRMDVRRGAVVRVLDGSVWLTQERDIEDHMLQPGDEVQLNGMGATLIKAYQASTLRLEQPARCWLPGWPRFYARWLAA
jgi:hypothetical protein